MNKILLHIVNALLLCLLLLKKYMHQGVNVSYGSDPLVIFLMLVGVILHLSRWNSIANERHEHCYTSLGALSSAITKVALSLYEGFEYFIKPIPSRAVIDRHVDSELKNNNKYDTMKIRDLLKLMVEIKNFLAIHLISSFLCLLALLLGDSLNYGAFKSVWFIVPLFMAFVAGLFIYSFSSVLLFVSIKLRKI